VSDMVCDGTEKLNSLKRGTWEIWGERKISGGRSEKDGQESAVSAGERGERSGNRVGVEHGLTPNELVSSD